MMRQAPMLGGTCRTLRAADWLSSTPYRLLPVRQSAAPTRVSDASVCERRIRVLDGKPTSSAARICANCPVSNAAAGQQDRTDWWKSARRRPIGGPPTGFCRAAPLARCCGQAGAEIERCQTTRRVPCRGPLQKAPETRPTDISYGSHPSWQIGKYRRLVDSRSRRRTSVE